MHARRLPDLHHPPNMVWKELDLSRIHCHNRLSMSRISKEEVSELLEDIAVLLELKGENPFKTRAYTNGARALQSLDGDLEEMVSDGTLKDVKGIGDALCKKITELVETGSLKFYEDLKASVEPGLVAMLDIPGLGPRKILSVHEKLGITDIDGLEKACREGKVEKLPGFGKKSQDKILQGIEFRRQHGTHIRLDEATEWAEEIHHALRDHPEVIRCAVAGSFRRSKEIIGDLDFLVSTNDPSAVIHYFSSLDGVSEILLQGETKVSVRLRQGTQADLRIIRDEEFPFALHYFTGSKEHNIAMRQRAIQKGLRLNEYGLFRSKTETRDPDLRVPCRTEEDIFNELGLSYIPPEMREDMGEFKLAEKDAIPRLVEWTRLKGSLHNHTNWSDGKNTLEQTARYMIDLGLEYWAITDHSKSSFQANGLDEKRLEEQVEAIRALNGKLEGEGESFRLLTGTEVDILSGGKLDFDDDILAGLDIVVASIHNGFSQKRDVMTARIIKAVENPNVHILGHPTGRLLLQRDPYELDINKVIDACAANGTWIELNASPYRLDLDWRHWSRAAEKGVLCAINPDAHRNEHAGFLKLATGVARKAGLTADQVVNTRPLNALLPLIK